MTPAIQTALALTAATGIVVLVVLSLLARRRHGAARSAVTSVRRRGSGSPLITRRAFEKRLNKAALDCAQSQDGVAVFFIGMDGFKRINREFGHDVGDRILLGVTSRLRALPGSFDAITHIGGDEFAAFAVTPRDRTLVRKTGERILAAIAEPHGMSGVDISVTCSVGICCYPEYRPTQKLMPYAQVAMCGAKVKGAGSIGFYRGERAPASDEALDLARDLRGAIARRELHLMFQPKIDAGSAQITGAEALLRWTHPERGIVPPAVFIPISEQFGLIDEIGDWVIEEACRQAHLWRRQGVRMRIAVNLSARQLLQPNLPQRIRAILRRYRIHPSLLTCEITESLAVESTAAYRLALINLQKSGMHISIDDFGTGYSNLSYLRELPARELKIDRSFVTDLGESEHAHSIVDAVIRMSHALGKRVVAEGVENRRQMEILVALGCDELQGYFFAKPMSSELLLLWATSPPDGSVAFHPALFGETLPQVLAS